MKTYSKHFKIKGIKYYVGGLPTKEALEKAIKNIKEKEILKS